MSISPGIGTVKAMDCVTVADQHPHRLQRTGLGYRQRDPHGGLGQILTFAQTPEFSTTAAPAARGRNFRRITIFEASRSVERKLHVKPNTNTDYTCVVGGQSASAVIPYRQIAVS